MITRLFSPTYLYLLLFNTFALMVALVVSFVFGAHVPLAIIITVANLGLIGLTAAIAEQQSRDIKLRNDVRSDSGSNYGEVE